MTAAFNRRMRKTARTVVWEGWRAKSRHLDPIRISWEITNFVGQVALLGVRNIFYADI
jgi:hypothetical protein